MSDDPRQCAGCGGDIDPISHDPKHPLHQPRQYGQPADCRGWRQFLVERLCPSLNPGKLAKLLPAIVWIEDGPPRQLLCCEHKGWTVHPSSVNAVVAVAGVPRILASYHVCEAQGVPIE